MRSPGISRSAPGSRNCTRRPAAPASQSSELPSRPGRDGDGLLGLAGHSHRSRRDRARGAARRRPRRRPSPRRRAGFRPIGGGGAHRGLEAVRERGDPAAGVPTARALSRREPPLRRQGRRPRIRQGRLRLSHATTSSRPGSRGARRSEPAFTSRSCSTATSSRCSRSATGASRRRSQTSRLQAGGDGDAGPNTGGMGASRPSPGFDASRAASSTSTTAARRARAALDAVRRFLFAGLMLTEDGPQVIEFNSRFGDPDPQVLVPRLRGPNCSRRSQPLPPETPVERRCARGLTPPR